MPGASDVLIVDWSRQFGDAFGRLNREWLERYFEVEPVDEVVLDNPEAIVIDPGGAILYAVVDGEAVGTVALKHHGNRVYELTKMAVTKARQGRGLGRLLMCAAVDRFRQIGGRTMFLESHSSLVPALALYESAGFRHVSPPAPSDYVRADVYMVYEPDSA